MKGLYAAGGRKVVICAMGLAELLAVAVVAANGNLPPEGLETLVWGTVTTIGLAMGANVGEHAFRAPKSKPTPEKEP